MALFKRKDKENKKGSENAIGKIIYGFLLFMPLLSIGVRCLYVIFNKNAYQSYSDNYVQTTQKVDNQTNFIEGDLVVAKYNGQQTTPLYSAFINYSSISIDWTDYGYTDTEYKAFRLFSNGIIQLKDNNNNITQKSNIWGITLNNFSFNYLSVENGSGNILDGGVNYYIQVLKQITLDNAFEYSINQTQENNLYNWAKETGTYTVLYNTTTGLGITNEFIPMLMAYWLIVSIIYFLFDIALILIWAVHKKIHDLSEAI